MSLKKLFLLGIAFCFNCVSYGGDRLHADGEPRVVQQQHETNVGKLEIYALGLAACVTVSSLMASITWIAQSGCVPLQVGSLSLVSGLAAGAIVYSATSTFNYQNAYAVAAAIAGAVAAAIAGWKFCSMLASSPAVLEEEHHTNGHFDFNHNHTGKEQHGCVFCLCAFLSYAFMRYKSVWAGFATYAAIYWGLCYRSKMLILSKKDIGIAAGVGAAVGITTGLAPMIAAKYL
ncbi:MAG: hypothetical protein LBF84_00615 [Holosporales bacterium]|jgi:hypothetical protein|nr:hypothetical protein [Holosporales bacterium]